ncbi:MAG: isoaspartyl peptidase/L-asparaginase [Actinomycetia bacterium]|nr:isoaspartyl peptidase/L-asparaginase [Actinomycetes bacterium]
MTECLVATSKSPYTLLVHGGAGWRHWRMDDAKEAAFRAGLRAAFAAGETVLAAGGAALDACCAAVMVLEDDPLFNAGRGASLTAAGSVEHEATVMTGDGRGGAVTLSRQARHPVLVARAVRDATEEVLIADPDDAFLAAHGLEVRPNDWFVTDERRDRLAAVRAGLPEDGTHKHGTVGCVALDAHGHLAAATSTGGYDNKPVGRVGDTAIPGAGTFAKDGVVAVSCTGRGESFMQGVVAHQVSARLEFGGQDLVTAATAVVTAELLGRGTTGALIAVDAAGRGVVAWDSPTLLACWRDGDEILTHV